MIVHDLPHEYWLARIEKGDIFSIGSYGDGEWEAIFHQKIGGMNAEGTIYTQELCDDLSESLKFKSPHFYFSSPAGLKRADWTGIGEEKIDRYLASQDVAIDFVEKDTWDKAVREGRFAPFIRQLRKMNVVVIGNKHLRGLNFLKYDKFVEVSYPNCHLEVDRVVEECLAYGKPGVYLFSAGLPAALMVQKLHGKIPDSWFLDIGSVWDAFVGIGAQRGWRAELYADEEKYKAWRALNLSDIRHLNIQPSDMADRVTILKIKRQHELEVQEELDSFLSEMPDIDQAFLDELFDVNLQIWNLEAQVGKMAFDIRKLNTRRTEIKNEITKKYGGYKDQKKFYVDSDHRNDVS